MTVMTEIIFYLVFFFLPFSFVKFEDRNYFKMLHTFSDPENISCFKGLFFIVVTKIKTIQIGLHNSYEK